MSPVGGAPVNAQPDKHNSKDQEDHLMVKLLMVNDQNTDGHNDHNNYDAKAYTIFLETLTMKKKMIMMGIKIEMLVMMITRQIAF